MWDEIKQLAQNFDTELDFPILCNPAIRFVEVMSNALCLVRIFAAIFREIICMFDCYAVLMSINIYCRPIEVRLSNDLCIVVKSILSVLSTLFSPLGNGYDS